MITDTILRDQVLDYTKSFLVQAPAGSGKTSLLVQRFLCLLAQVEQAPEEILAITFTRKAAAEMRERVLSAIKLGLQPQPPSDPYQHKFWKLAQKVIERDRLLAWDLLDNPARLKIQTIDALCSRIAAQMPITAQFGAIPQVAENPEELYAKAVNMFLDATKDAVWQSQANILFAHLDNDMHKVKNLLITMLRVRDQWLPILFGIQQQDDLRNILQAGLYSEIAAVLANATLNMPIDVDFSILPEYDFESVSEWQSIANLLLTASGDYRRTVTEAQGFAAPSKVKDKQQKALLKDRKDRMLALLEILVDHKVFQQCLVAISKLPHTEYSDPQWQIIQALFTLLPLLTAHLTLVFKEVGNVDFIAISIAALNALQSPDAPTDLALALDCKIQHILVDEFQDTSVTQFSILERLTANWSPYDGKTLFLVGDPMQSIYRFRKAEVSLFLRAKQYGVNNITLDFVSLTMNFRSSPGIVTWINTVFAQTFPDLDDIGLGAIRYTPASAVIANARINTAQDAVECINVTGASEPQQIIDILENIQSKDPSKTIAILVRAKSHVANLLPLLRTRNIAYQAPGIELLNQRPLVQDLLALTHALLHFEDRIAWLAILRAPWCGLELIDLTLVAASDDTIWNSMLHVDLQVKLTADGLLRVQRFVAVMGSILQLIGRDPIHKLVRDLWTRLGGLELLQDLAQLDEADAYFEFLTQFAHKREIFTPGFLQQQIAQLCMPVAQIDPLAVQIMTIHKAKGLEFDVVILPSLAQRTRHDDHKLLLIEQRQYPEYSLLMAPLKSATEEHDQIYKYMTWAEQQRAKYETLRLLYVATTRAKSQIYCLADIGEQAPVDSSLLGQIWSVVSDNFISTVITNQPVAHEERMITRLPTAWFKQNTYLSTELCTSKIIAKPWQQDWQRLVGIVVHRSFWLIVQHGHLAWNEKHIDLKSALWTQQLIQLGLQPIFLQQALAMIARAVQNALEDELGANILSNLHPESYAEWRLSVYELGECKQIVLDRAFLDQDGQFWIVDYKIVTNEYEVVSLVEQYSRQLRQYATAVKNLRPGVNIKIGLYLPLQKLYIPI